MPDTVRTLMVAPPLKRRCTNSTEAPSLSFSSPRILCFLKDPPLLASLPILTPQSLAMMYPTLFTTTLVFALAALRVRADFEVDTVELTQVSNSPKDSPFPVFSRSFRLVWITVPARDPQVG